MNRKQIASYARIAQAMQEHTHYIIDWEDSNQEKHFVDHKQESNLYGIDARFKYQTIGAIYGSYEACQFIIDNHKKDLDILRGAL